MEFLASLITLENALAEIWVKDRPDTGRDTDMLTMTRYGTRDLERAKSFYDAIAETHRDRPAGTG
jgi:hypothetical protein